MKIYKIVFLFMIVSNLQAQSQKKDTSFIGNTELKIGFSGNMIWENGMHIGLEYKWKEYIKTKKKKRKKKKVVNQFLFNGNLGYLTNLSTDTDNGGYSRFGIVWRRTNKKGRQLQVELNPLGYYRSFLHETYKVEGDRVSEVPLPGRSYYSPSIAFGIGKLRENKRRSGWYLNLQYSFLSPYNAGVYPMISIQYGYRFNFKKLES